MVDDLKKYILQNVDGGINTGAHPLALPEGHLIDCHNMFVRGRGRLQEFKPHTTAAGLAVIDNVETNNHITATNGSSTLTSSADVLATYNIRPGMSLFYREDDATGFLPDVGDAAGWYRVMTVASDGLSLTIDRDWEESTVTFTTYILHSGGHQHGFCYPAYAVCQHDNVNDEETLHAVAGNLLRRWTGAAWNTEYTLSHHHEPGKFIDYRGQALFANGKDEMLRSYTGNGDWDSLADPVIEKITVQHTESGFHNGVTEFTFVNGSSIDDAIFEGAFDDTDYGAPLTADVKIKVEITTLGTPDQFDWYIDTGGGYGGSQGTLNCTTAAQALGTTGITVRFGVTTGHQGVTPGDTWEFYAVYDTSTYNVKIKDCAMTPTKALILAGTIEAYDIGNTKTVVAAMIMRSLNKGQSWTAIEKRYRTQAVQNPGGYGTTTVGGLFVRESGEIFASIATVGEISSNYRTNALPRIEQFCYVLSSNTDGDAFSPIFAITGVLTPAQQAAGGLSPGTQDTIDAWATANDGLLMVEPFAGYEVAWIKGIGDVSDPSRPPHAFDQFCEHKSPEEGTVVTCAGMRDFYQSADDYDEYSMGILIKYPPDKTGLDFGFDIDLSASAVSKHKDRPLLLGPVDVYDASAGEYRLNAGAISYTQGDADATTPPTRARIEVYRREQYSVSTSYFPDGKVNFDYGNAGVTPKGYPYFSVGGPDWRGTKITKDIGVLGILGSWGGWAPLGRYYQPNGPLFFWTNKSNNFYYCLSKKIIGATGVERLVLSISDDEGETFSPVWQDAENTVASEYCRKVLHWSSNEFIVVMEDSSSIYRCRYHVNAPKAKNVIVWRQRLLAYGEMLDLASPRGATPDNISANGLVLRYQGMDWEDNELVGFRLYPDIVGNPTVYYPIVSNTNDEVTVETNMRTAISGIEDLDLVFEIREYAPQRIRISDVNRFDTWPAFNFTDEDDKVMAIRPFLQTGFETPQSGILVLMEEGHALYLGNSPDAWIRYAGKTQRGCIGPYAISEDMTLSHDAISIIQEGQPMPLRGRLDESHLETSNPGFFSERLDSRFKDEAFGFLRLGLEFLCVNYEGSPWANRAIVLDVLRGGFWGADFATAGEYSPMGARAVYKNLDLPCYFASAFTDKAGAVAIGGGVSGIVYTIFSATTKTVSNAAINTTIPLNAGAPEEWFGIHKIGLMIYVASNATLDYRFNPNVSGWTAWDTHALTAGMNRVIITAPQPMEGNTIALNLRIKGAFHKEILMPVEFSAQLKHSGVEEG